MLYWDLHWHLLEEFSFVSYYIKFYMKYKYNLSILSKAACHTKYLYAIQNKSTIYSYLKYFFDAMCINERRANNFFLSVYMIRAMRSVFQRLCTCNMGSPLDVIHLFSWRYYLPVQFYLRTAENHWNLIEVVIAIFEKIAIVFLRVHLACPSFCVWNIRIQKAPPYDEPVLINTKYE
jgi:hypothetical protein